MHVLCRSSQASSIENWYTRAGQHPTEHEALAVTFVYTWCGDSLKAGFWCRCSKCCSLLLLATAAGLVAWHLVAHSPQPDWEDVPPNCLVDDGTIVAVRNQVSVLQCLLFWQCSCTHQQNCTSNEPCLLGDASFSCMTSKYSILCFPSRSLRNASRMCCPPLLRWSPQLQRATFCDANERALLQVMLSEGCDFELLLLVAAQIGVQPASPLDTAENTLNPQNLRILADPIQAEQWYCVHNKGVELLRAPWLRMLTARLNQCESIVLGARQHDQSLSVALGSYSC